MKRLILPALIAVAFVVLTPFLSDISETPGIASETNNTSNEW